MTSHRGKHVVLRVDSSLLMGTGHVVRCLALARTFKKQGSQVSFICRDLPGNITSVIKDEFEVFLLTGDTDWQNDSRQTFEVIQSLERRPDILGLDHYAYDHHWEEVVKKAGFPIFVIDDLADRTHDCDFLIDQNYYQLFEERYDSLLPQNTKKLLGPQYALLRPEFIDQRKTLRPREGDLKRILVFFGGGDSTNETQKALKGIAFLKKRDFHVDIVLGATNPYQQEIKDWALQNLNSTVHIQTSQMPELMASADLALGAGGTSTWERCCLGLPALVVILADNQEKLAQDVDHYGAHKNLGWAYNLTAEMYTDAISSLTSQDLQAQSKKGLALIDGLGAGRVVKALMAEMRG